jgi:putative ABC transport system permease protein
MLWDAMKLVVIGLIVGIPVALGASSLLSSFLYGLKSTDPASLFVVIVILATVALTSSYLPARRATKVDPLTALREE